jgi:hypothetical protein
VKIDLAKVVTVEIALTSEQLDELRSSLRCLKGLCCTREGDYCGTCRPVLELMNAMDEVAPSE